MPRPKGLGYVPDMFDKQFLKIIFDLQSRSIDLAKNEMRLEKVLGLTKGVLWKIKNGVTGVGNPRRHSVVKQLQELFDVNPMYFSNNTTSMYNGTGPKVPELAIEDYSEVNRDHTILTAGDYAEFKRLRIENELLKEKLRSKDIEIKRLESTISVLNKLVAQYEKTDKITDK